MQRFEGFWIEFEREKLWHSLFKGETAVYAEKRRGYNVVIAVNLPLRSFDAGGQDDFFSKRVCG